MSQGDLTMQHSPSSTRRKMKKRALCLAITAGLSGYALAQDTTKSILGKNTSPTGSPAAQTKVVIVHQPSGTVSEVVTNETGAYSVKGLRVGGPYQVTIDSDVYRDAQLNNLYLQVGKTLRLDQQLEEQVLEEEAQAGRQARARAAFGRGISVRRTAA